MTNPTASSMGILIVIKNVSGVAAIQKVAKGKEAAMYFAGARPLGNQALSPT